MANPNQQKMKRLLLVLTLLGQQLFAQTPRQVVVEHFTNTFCSVCASRNPGFKTNLASQPDVMHISYHPSSPYSQCYFNKQNKEENDNRTKFYGVFGSTPRLVINGVAISSSANYSSSAIFDPYKNINVEVAIFPKLKKEGDSLILDLTIKATGNNTFREVILFAGLANKQINYAAGNGEQVHNNVFRKAFPTESIVFIPQNAGDSINLRYSLAVNSLWNLSDLYAYVVLSQQIDKITIQAAKSNELGLASGNAEKEVVQLNVYPNPVSNEVNLPENLIGKEFRIYNIYGKELLGNVLAEPKLSLETLTNGVYLLLVQDESKIYKATIIKQ